MNEIQKELLFELLKNQITNFLESENIEFGIFQISDSESQIGFGVDILDFTDKENPLLIDTIRIEI